MLLKQLNLENIRSYTKQTINFPDGVTLLSGDVGAGKSTILLAIEFALFGLLKGMVDGETLLRNGCMKGSVTLTVELDGKEIKVHRGLKRSLSVTQDTGYIEIDSKREYLGATELKQRVLDLLNYPKELLTKSKSIIYRYTVYTPQEEMKSILLGEQEHRFDVLRKVFGIDKYKRIQDNTMIILSKLRERKRIFQAKLEELKNVEQEYLNKTQERNILAQQIENIIPRLQDAQATLAQTQQKYIDAEKKLQEQEKLEHEKQQLQMNLNYEEQRMQQLQTNVQQLQQQKQQLEQQIKNVKYDPEKRAITKQLIFDTEKKIQEHMKSLAGAEMIIMQSGQMLENLTSLDICPTCKQKVSKDHMQAMHLQEQIKIQEQEEIALKINNSLQAFEQERKRYTREDEILQQQESMHNVYQSQQKNMEGQQQQITQLQDEFAHAQSKILQLRDKLAGQLPASLEQLRQDFRAQRDLVEQLQQQERSLAIEHASISTKLQGVITMLRHIEEQRQHRNQIEQKFTKLTGHQELLEQVFVPLVEMTEKKIMLKVHSDFNSAFKKWFDILMDSDVIDVTIDSSFSPSIQQNGYDVSYENLSGGEKTACALAYRLALNHVINEMMSAIKTRDLVILDEPTDGFSDDQLGRLRIVLEELNAKQVIIVSHESKVETFAQHMLKVEKKVHASQVS